MKEAIKDLFAGNSKCSINILFVFFLTSANVFAKLSRFAHLLGRFANTSFWRHSFLKLADVDSPCSLSLNKIDLLHVAY